MKLTLAQLCTALHQCVSARCDVECPRVQKAIDDMAGCLGLGGRAQLLAALLVGRRDGAVARQMHFALMEAWVKPHVLEWATGRSRDQWLELCT